MNLFSHFQIIKKTALLSFLSAFFFLTSASCSSPLDIFSTRPKLEMSYAEAAIKAAQDANAETLAPAHYRKANSHFIAAKKAYRNKNFGDARRHAQATQSYAEEAEFQALSRQGTSPKF